MREVLAFLAALRRSWVALVGGSLGILSAAVGIWGPSSVGANRLFLAAGVAGILYSAFLIWRGERRRWLKQLRLYRRLLHQKNEKLDEMEHRIADINRQIQGLSDAEVIALATLGRLGEVAASNLTLFNILGRVDFVLRDQGRFRPTDGYRAALSQWAKRNSLAIALRVSSDAAEPPPSSG